MNNLYYPVQAKPVTAHKVSFRDMEILIPTLAFLEGEFIGVHITTVREGELAVFFSDGELQLAATSGNWVVHDGLNVFVVTDAEFAKNYVKDRP